MTCFTYIAPFKNPRKLHKKEHSHKKLVNKCIDVSKMIFRGKSIDRFRIYQLQALKSLSCVFVVEIKPRGVLYLGPRQLCLQVTWHPFNGGPARQFLISSRQPLCQTVYLLPKLPQQLQNLLKFLFSFRHLHRDEHERLCHS